MRNPVWTGCAAGLSVLLVAALAAGAQQVTLPLPQYEELRNRANPAAAEPPAPPAPYALESADFAIVAGATSARITQTLVLTIYADGWQRVPLGEAGSFTSARFGDLEGRVEVKDDGWALQVKGRGRHEVKLESVVPVSRDETAIRPAWSFALRFPPAAVVRGRLQAPAEVEEVELSGAGLIRREAGVSGDKAAGWGFVAAFADPGAGFTLYGRRTLPPRAQLPLRFDAVTSTAVMLSRTQFHVSGWIEVRVAQGRLEELKVPVPAGLKVVSVDGPRAGWNVADGVLVVTPLAPVETSLALTVEMSAAGEPPQAFASPLLIPAGARRTLLLTRAALQGDGLLRLADAGAVRAPEESESGALPAAVRGAAGRLFAVLDPAKPPRWEVEWAEHTQVLASQVDRLLIDVVVGESGRAAYQLWAEVRNRGAQQLGITLPPGFELVSAGRDGEPVAVGDASGAFAVPLQTGEAAQTIHLAGLLPLALPPGNGDFQVPLPSLTAPAARVEVRLVLPASRSASLADPTRAGRITPPQPATVRRDAAASTNAIAKQVLANTRIAVLGGGSGLFPRPPGFTEISAVWNALSAAPLPLALRIKSEKEKPSWF